MIWISVAYEALTLTTLLFLNGFLILHATSAFDYKTSNIIVTYSLSLCMNCNIAIHDSQQYEYNALSMIPEMVSIIEEWTAQEVTDGDRICQECINLLVKELNNRNEHNIGDRQLGHQSVCVCCVISISRRTGRRSYPLPDGHPERSYIASIINPRQIPANARACNACWQRAHNNIHEVMEPPRQAQVSEDNVESRSSSSSTVAEPVTPLHNWEKDCWKLCSCDDNCLVSWKGLASK